MQNLVSRSRNGLGLVEVLIGIGIMGILAAGMTSVIMNGLKGKAGVEQSLEKVDLENTIQLILNNNVACKQAFKSTVTNLTATFDPGAAPISNLNRITLGNAVIADLGQKLPGSKNLTLSEMTLTPVPAMPSVSTISGFTDYFVQLHLKVTKLDSSITLGPMTFWPIDRFFKITVNDASKQIVDCSRNGYDCLMTRTDKPLGGDTLSWCPTNHPRLSSCRTVDNQAPVGTVKMDMSLAAASAVGCHDPAGGKCDALIATGVGYDRTGLGTDVQYMETVIKSAADPVDGCWVYDHGHVHTAYRVEINCCVQ